jgi:formamidopyrimidine-DNA glycosylase
MPELPEVEFARGCLERWLAGEVLVRIEVDPTRVIRGSSRATFGQLAGRRITLVERRGKCLLVHFEGELALFAHLGMTGKFELARPEEAAPRWSRARFVRANGTVVHYRDPRQFGRLSVGPLTELLGAEPFRSLGPDAWTETVRKSDLAERLGKSARTVKEVLMDQSVLAGLGNIQVTEALFLARVHPARKSKSLDAAEVSRIVKGIRTSLTKALAMNSGDKITYVEEGKRRENPFLVYGKAGEPCPRCKTPLKKITLSGRTSAFCPNCQPRTAAANYSTTSRSRVRRPVARAPRSR